MIRYFKLFVFTLFVFGASGCNVIDSLKNKTSNHEAINKMIKIETNKGDIILELNEEQAPKTVENFLNYVNDGFYNGTIFHRVINNFMIQGGGMTPDFANKDTKDPIQNEADNGLKNERGTIAMARTPNPHSATSQFFINTANNSFLNFQSETSQGWGYAVFGKVTSGMDVVDAISIVATTNRAGHQDVPVEDVVINKISLLDVEPADVAEDVNKEGASS